MVLKISRLLNKYKDVAIYLIFGVLTTVVNYLVYLPLYNIAQWSATLSNAVAWFFAVAFAFLTNKPFVFKSNDWSAKTVFSEAVKFVGCRVGSGLMETASIFLLVDVLALNGNVIKLMLSIAVVILNYFASKLLVFKKK